MIKSNISREYPSHLTKYSIATEDIFVADYTEQTKNDLIKRSVEVFHGNHPIDIDYFSLINSPQIDIGSIIFDNSSFTYSNGNARSQCECFVIPDSSTANSWVLFVELKYSNLPHRNSQNLNKAKGQLFKTRCYYYLNNIFDKNSTCYLIASLPMQREPFANFSLTASYIQNLKRKHNVILRFKNRAEIIDAEQLNV